MEDQAYYEHMKKEQGETIKMSGIEEENEILKLPQTTIIRAAQNGLIARMYLLQEQMMKIINDVGTIPSEELIAAAERLESCILHFEVHVRKMNGRHTENAI